MAHGYVYSIFDTGSSSIMIPKDYFSNFLRQIFVDMEGNEYEVASGYVITKCYRDFPVLHFLFDERWIAVFPADYLVDISEAQDRSICVLLLSPGQ